MQTHTKAPMHAKADDALCKKTSIHEIYHGGSTSRSVGTITEGLLEHPDGTLGARTYKARSTSSDLGATRTDARSQPPQPLTGQHLAANADHC